ncbi:MAG: PAS-domain containing protein [Burkholderiaceae bacterium]|nr:PAS-domain containing protein [Burkholderiaceae bacterium]
MSASTSALPDRLERYQALQAALNLIDQGFTLMDQNLRLLAWNQSFLRLLDFPDGMAYVGAAFEDFIRHNAERGEYGPGDLPTLVASRLAAARRFEPHEFERIRPNGQVLQVRGLPVPGVGFISLYSDITAQKQTEQQILEHAAELERRVAERTSELRLSEAQMRLITDNIPALIAYVDKDKLYRYINRGYKEWFGLDPQHLDHISAREYLGHATYDAIRPNVARAFAGDPVSFEYAAHCVDERVRTVRTTLIPEKASDGSVMGCFELTFDVTELRRAEQRLAHAEKMEALGQLTGGLAHDLNNMLTVIIGNLGALHEQLGTDEHATEYVEPALAAARRGAELIQALQSFARRQPLHAEAADVERLSHTVVKLLQRSLPEGMRLHVEVQTTPPSAWVDPNQLQDALVNLLLNARDAQARRVVVRLSTEWPAPQRSEELRLAPGSYVRIDVEDNGHGMDASTRSRVFEPFFTTKRAGAGTGLGLSMVYGFVRQSGGAVEIDSTPGQGTTVSIWMPTAPGAAAPSPQPPHAAPEPLAEQTLALLVEDDPEVRKVVRRALIRLGFAVIEAENGSEALSLLTHTADISLVLSDVVMPGPVDGRVVARHALARNVPQVALMSGYAPAETGPGETGDELPMLAKPFTPRQLADFLRHIARV